MSRETYWYVITGGPCTGKTTLLDELAKLGHITVPEAARWVIENGLKKGLTLEQIRADVPKFQDTVLRHKMRMEAKQSPDVLTFFDRGIHDTIGYLKFHNCAITPLTKKAISGIRYAKVFVLDALPHYVQDNVRTETADMVVKLNDYLFEAYANAGLPTFRVPPLSVEERLAFVLEHVNADHNLGARA